MKRTLAGSTALVLTILLSGCGDDGGADDDPTDGTSSSATPTSAGTESTGTGSTGADEEGEEGAEGEEGDPETETFARGADVAEFCAAMAEIDSAIDEAQEGSDEDWQRIVDSFDALEDLGVPDDLPASGITEITEVDLLVRQSDSVAELNAAAEDYRPESRTIDDYLDDNCA